MQEQGYDNHIKTVMAPAAKLLLYGRLARVSISPMDVMGFSLNGTVEYCRNHGSHQLSFGREGGRGGDVASEAPRPPGACRGHHRHCHRQRRHTAAGTARKRHGDGGRSGQEPSEDPGRTGRGAAGNRRGTGDEPARNRRGTGE